MAVEQLLAAMRKQAWQERNRSRSEERRSNERILLGPWRQMPAPESLRPVEAADEMRIVMRSQFIIQPLLNKSEARVFRELDSMVIGCNSSWQVMAQVSFGEILRSTDADAHRCINSKRVDLLLVDSNCQPRHVIEYQGGGHHQGAAAARDAVKKEALRRAGVGYHEVWLAKRPRQNLGDWSKSWWTNPMSSNVPSSQISARPSLGLHKSTSSPSRQRARPFDQLHHTWSRDGLLRQRQHYHIAQG